MNLFQMEKTSTSKFKEIFDPPKTKNGDFLREYQIFTVNWMRSLWYQGRNNILADKMGHKNCSNN
jgi:SNF2 family DNA or RNA helicase